MNSIIKMFVIFILMAQSTNVFAANLTLVDLLNSSDYYLKELVIDRENISFYDSLGISALRNLNAGDIVYMKLQMNESLEGEYYRTLFKFYFELREEGRNLGVECSPTNPLISEYIGQVNLDTEYASFYYSKINGVDFKYSIKIYVFSPYDRSLEVNVNHTIIGDNTRSLINITTTKLNDDVVNISSDSSIIYTSVMSDLSYYLEPKEGDNNIRVSIVNNAGVLKKSYDVTINKMGILGDILSVFSVKETHNKVLFLTDRARYYENNLLNRQLVDEILQANNKVFLVGDILPSSNVLNPLLKP